MRVHLRQGRIADDMRNEVGRRMWLKVRVGKSLSSDNPHLELEFLGRPVIVANDDKGEPLSEARWLLFSARGFKDEEEANDFGERLRRAIHLAGLSAKLGVDGRLSGHDRKLGEVGENWPRQMGLLKPHQRYAPDVHGILIMPDDDNTLMPRMSVSGSVAASPSHFLHAIGEGDNHNTCPPVLQAIYILNLALINHEPIAEIVLAISAIESLAGPPKWKVSQRLLIDELTRGHLINIFWPGS